MQAFTPMLCWRSHSHLEDVVRAMHRQRNVFDPARQLEPGEYGNREFLVEEKLDGERIQLHKQGNKFQYFSRQVCFVFWETGQGGLESDDRGQTGERLTTHGCTGRTLRPAPSPHSSAMRFTKTSKS